MDLARFPRRRYTPGWTPLEHLPHLTRYLDGPHIFIKRDDLLGLAAGGNKTRKLEFLVADALRQGADTLITVGAVQSNHCRLTLGAAVKEGMRCRLVLEQRVPNSYDPDAGGNNFLFRLLGVEKTTVVDLGTDLGAAMQAEADELAEGGRKGYVIPGGGSNPLGTLGYVSCAMEILGQAFEKGIQFDHLVCASGSGGTHAGLLVGMHATGSTVPITGISVRRPVPEQEGSSAVWPPRPGSSWDCPRNRWKASSGSSTTTSVRGIPFQPRRWLKRCASLPAQKVSSWTRSIRERPRQDSWTSSGRGISRRGRRSSSSTPGAPRGSILTRTYFWTEGPAHQGRSGACRSDCPFGASTGPAAPRGRGS
jgi:1-aminocyclopropane-1-carboxylate deaminase/D-cysteine desulfhydrase-like pyridoxal-dependent ACC family enzyme